MRTVYTLNFGEMAYVLNRKVHKLLHVCIGRLPETCMFVFEVQGDLMRFYVYCVNFNYSLHMDLVIIYY